MGSRWQASLSSRCCIIMLKVKTPTVTFLLIVMVTSGQVPTDDLEKILRFVVKMERTPQQNPFWPPQAVGDRSNINLINIADNQIRIKTGETLVHTQPELKTISGGDMSIEEEPTHTEQSDADKHEANNVKDKVIPADWQVKSDTWNTKKSVDGKWKNADWNQESWNGKTSGNGDWKNADWKAGSWSAKQSTSNRALKSADWNSINLAGEKLFANKEPATGQQPHLSLMDDNFGFWGKDDSFQSIESGNTANTDVIAHSEYQLRDGDTPGESHVAKTAAIEERAYPETVFICAYFNSSREAADEHMGTAINNSLDRITNYLQGDNDMHTSLTANEPVFYGMSETRPQFTFETCRWISQNDNKARVPGPTNDGVSIKLMPRATFYVRKFDMINSEDEAKFWAMETMRMKSDLMELNLKFDTETCYGTKNSINLRQVEVMFKKEE